MSGLLSPIEEEPEELDDSPSPLPLQTRPRPPPPPADAPSTSLLSELLAQAAATVEELGGGGGGPAARLPPLRLSDALRLGLGSVGGGRLSLVQCLLTQLDEPGAAAAAAGGAVSTLLLSRNALRSLAGAPRLLRPLQQLSLSFNLLSDAAALEQLGRACPELRALWLEGNPLCAVLDARAHAIANLPLLRLFDGRQLAPGEREEACACVRAECAFFDALLPAAAELLALERASALAPLLSQLRGGAPAPRGGARRLAALWPPDLFAGGGERGRLLTALRLEARRLRRAGEPRPLLALEARVHRALLSARAQAPPGDSPPDPAEARLAARLAEPPPRRRAAEAEEAAAEAAAADGPRAAPPPLPSPPSPPARAPPPAPARAPPAPPPRAPPRAPPRPPPPPAAAAREAEALRCALAAAHAAEQRLVRANTALQARCERYAASNGENALAAEAAMREMAHESAARSGAEAATARAAAAREAAARERHLNLKPIAIQRPRVRARGVRST